MTDNPASKGLFLICRSAPHLCALPLDNVIETMRALPREKIAVMPPFVLGVSIVRGAVVPVIDMARLLDNTPGNTQDSAHHAEPLLYVTLRLGARVAALGVDEVVGIRSMDAQAHASVTPLLAHTNDAIITSMSTLDRALLLVLQASHLVPDPLWAVLDALPAPDVPNAPDAPTTQEARP